MQKVAKNFRTIDTLFKGVMKFYFSSGTVSSSKKVSACESTESFIFSNASVVALSSAKKGNSFRRGSAALSVSFSFLSCSLMDF